MAAADAQHQANTRLWGSRGLARQYGGTSLLDGEAEVLRRFREDFSGRVLEIGCGAGRVTGHLAAMSDDVRAVDISAEMLASAEPLHPAVDFALADLHDLTPFADADADVVALWDNLIDILGHDARAATLAQLRRMLRPGGLLVLDTHNLAHAPHRRRPTDLSWDSPRQLARSAAGLPVKLYNHRRLARHEQTADGWAVLNDEAHHFTSLHYYVGRAEQERQLRVTGLDLLAIVDRAGGVLEPGASAPDSPSLTYVARRPT